MDRTRCNALRYEGDAKGHYESYFQRANHPSRKLAFWVRYTLFSPKGRPKDTVAELWGVFFDGEKNQITPVKVVVPYVRSDFGKEALDVRIDDARLDTKSLRAEISVLGNTLGWDLRYTSPTAPLLLLPEALYGAPFPTAKALVGSPMAVYDGTFVVNGETYPIEGWVGSQNHNWGEKHTDEYAWGQVAGFDDARASFLELSTARVKLGPVRTPWMTPLVLRHEGREFALNAITTTIRARAQYAPFRWDFDTTKGGVRIAGSIAAGREDFVGLPYDNPPGGRKTCLNSKVAQCRITLDVRGERPVTLFTANRAAFEILTDATDHGVPVLGV